MKEYSKAQLAYLAGMIDGEGAVTLTKTSSESELRLPRLGVASTSKELVEYLENTFGGTISSKKTYEDHHKKSFCWMARYNKCLELLKAVLPYLRENSKKRRARLLVNHYKDITPRNGKYTDKQKERKLKFQKHFFHPDQFQNWNQS